MAFSHWSNEAIKLSYIIALLGFTVHGKASSTGWLVEVGRVGEVILIRMESIYNPITFIDSLFIS